MSPPVFVLVVVGTWLAALTFAIHPLTRPILRDADHATRVATVTTALAAAAFTAAFILRIMP